MLYSNFIKIRGIKGGKLRLIYAVVIGAPTKSNMQGKVGVLFNVVVVVIVVFCCRYKNMGIKLGLLYNIVVGSSLSVTESINLSV